MANPNLIARKRAYVRSLEEMRDNEIAREIAYLEGCSGSFAAWQLGQAVAELDHRI